jgi:hypothetical protein
VLTNQPRRFGTHHHHGSGESPVPPSNIVNGSFHLRLRLPMSRLPDDDIYMCEVGWDSVPFSANIVSICFCRAAIAQPVWWRATGRMAGVRFLEWAKYFSLLNSSQTGSGAHEASYPMGTVGYFPRGKAARSWS